MTDRQNLVENADEQEINLLELLQVLVKRKMLIVKLVTVAIVASVGYSLTLPDIYSATAMVLPPPREGGSGLSALLSQGGLASLTQGGLSGGSDLYVGIMKSRSVSNAVMQRLDLLKVYKGASPDAVRKSLEGALSVQAGKDGIISITVDDKDPKRAAQLANAFADELGRATVRLNLTRVGAERLFLEKRLDLAKISLKAAEDDLKSFAQKNKIIQVDAQASASLTALARLKSDLSVKEVELSVLRSQQTEQSPEVQVVQSAIRKLKGQIEAMAGNGGGEGIPSVGNVPGIGLEYSRKLRELKMQEAVFDQLTKQYEIAKLTEAKDSSALQVLDEAAAPSEKSKPQRSRIVIFATVVAFMASLVIVFVQEYLSKISDEDRKIIESIKKSALALK